MPKLPKIVFLSFFLCLSACLSVSFSLSHSLFDIGCLYNILLETLKLRIEIIRMWKDKCWNYTQVEILNLTFSEHLGWLQCPWECSISDIIKTQICLLRKKGTASIFQILKPKATTIQGPMIQWTKKLKTFYKGRLFDSF